ncbi:MAG: hypothetical protein HFH68_00320 [Lachnospiraceae bacterium]|nr:hypothetical protein [Lachnospiraceae bacterium]
MEEILEIYYADNARKLQGLVDKVVNKKFGGVTGKDMSSYYSSANEVMANIVKNHRYDPSKGSFEWFLRGSLNKAFIDDYKYDNRDKRKTKIEVEELNEKGQTEKRKIPVPDIYLDAPAGESGDYTIGDIIPSGFDLDTVLSEGTEGFYSDTLEEFLGGLSGQQRQICSLIMEGYTPDEIKTALELTDKEYKNSWGIITSYENKRILYKEIETGSLNSCGMEDCEMGKLKMLSTQDMEESYKNISYSIESISKKLRKKQIKDNHILQRYSGQWKNFTKSELVKDILIGKSLTQIIISEEIKDGIRMKWLIDGKQRCTALDEYLHDGFAVSKNIKNYNIMYTVSQIDENGNEVLNEEGFNKVETRVFDIRGKKFSQLPYELQEIFKDRQIPVLYNTDCTKKDIAEDIARFNRSRPMNKAQNGWLNMDETFAGFVFNIEKMPFFQPDFIGSSYTKTTKISSSARRIIIEGIMVSDFIDEFCSFDKMCEFLSKEACDTNFTDFYVLVERLTSICTKETASLFNVKNSFLWFGLFSRFSQLGIEDSKFAGFMGGFINSLHSQKINGESYDDILANNKNTKDKNIVKRKINHLEKLMLGYLGIINLNEEEAGSETGTESIDTCTENITASVIDEKAFIMENVGTSQEELNEDLEFYKESLDTLTISTVKDGSNLLEKENRLSLLAMVAYSYKEDIDLDDWLEGYAQKYNTYFKDQKKNYIYMRNDLINFIKEEKKIRKEAV